MLAASPETYARAGALRPLPSDPAAGDKGAASWSMIDSAVQRLEETLDQETAALQSGARTDLQDFSNRKSQCLLELTRVLRPLEGTAAEPLIVERMTGLRAKLAANRAVLERHLEAVREISTALSEAMRAADSDGTYSPAIKGNGARP
jgi:hypothetical protein